MKEVIELQGKTSSFKKEVRSRDDNIHRISEELQDQTSTFKKEVRSRDDEIRRMSEAMRND